MQIPQDQAIIFGMNKVPDLRVILMSTSFLDIVDSCNMIR